MRAIFILVLMFISMVAVSCKLSVGKPKEEKGEYVFNIRQMVNTTNSTMNGAYFLFAGSISSEQDDMIKMFLECGNSYRLVSLKLERVHIIVNDSLDKPNFVVEYVNENLERHIDCELVRDELITFRDWDLVLEKYIINCPTKYLPEMVLPIALEN